MTDLPFRPGNVMIDYTNHAGARAIREIIPSHTDPMWFGSTEWHHEEQWLLDAHDVEKNALRTFAVKDIHAWAPKATATGRSMASYAKQLQQSMERNARMVNRLKQLSAHAETVNDGDYTPFELLLHVVTDFPAAIAAIMKDEDPSWPAA